MFKYFNFTRLFHYIFLSLSKMPMRAHYRWRFLKLGGVKFNFANGRGECYIYKRVSIDTVAPDLLILGNRVTLTEGTTILTHFLDPTKPGRNFRLGKVIIEDDVFIGVNTVICNSVRIGKGSIIGAGSVLTKDIPPYQVWAGNPAHYIKNRAIETESIK